MTICTFYDPLTGQITGNGDLSDDTLMAYKMAGLGLFAGEVASAATHYVDITETPFRLVEFAAEDQHHLANAKDRARARINLARDTAEHAPFAWNGYLFDANTVSTARITGAVSLAMMAAMAEQPFSKEWTLADNSSVMLDGPAMMAVGATLGVRVGEVFDIARSLKEQIESATTPAQADAITWPEA